MNNTVNHYNENYFEGYQKEIGEFGGLANLFKFKYHIKESDNVLDFGCGGGFLLNNIDCNYKAGVEVNKYAREHSIKNFSIDCFEDLDEIEENKFDVIISNHVLEHCDSPNEIIRNLRKKLKIGGKIVIVVPYDRFSYNKKDINKHLFSFSPMNIGNILQVNGFKKIVSTHLHHKWPPGWLIIYKLFGLKVFHFTCKIYGVINLSWSQSIAVAYK